MGRGRDSYFLTRFLADWPHFFAMAAGSSWKNSKLFIVEHLDPELGDWSALEYRTIAQESYEAGVRFCLSAVPPSLTLPDYLQSTLGFETNSQSVETAFADQKDRVCL